MRESQVWTQWWQRETMKTQNLREENSAFAKAAERWQLLKPEVPRRDLLGRKLKNAQTSFIYQKLLSYIADSWNISFTACACQLQCTWGQFLLSACRGNWDHTDCASLHHSCSRARQGDTTKRLFIICCTSSPRKQKSSICAHLICHIREHCLFV